MKAGSLTQLFAVSGLALLLGASTAYAQLTGVKAIPGDYPTLSAALSDLASNGVGTGGVVFELQPSFTGAGEAYPLTIGVVSGASPSNRVVIRPAASVGSPLTLSSSAASTILLNQADYITFDGRPGGSGVDRYLQVVNTSTSGSAITLTNDATFNILTYLQVVGATSSATSGVLAFLPGTNVGNSIGVSNNVLSHSLVESQSPSFAANLFYSAGSTNAGYRNGNNTLSDNLFNNFTANGILVDATSQGNGPNWAISGNSLYNATAVSTVAQAGINLSPGVNSTGGHTISNNIIGGTAPNAGGSAWQRNGANAFNGILFNSNSSVASSITGNTVQNIQNLNTGAAPMNGIQVAGGTRLTTTLTISGNTIGHPSDAAKGLISAANAALYGILSATTNAVDLNITTNTVANLVHNGAGSGSVVFGIYRLGSGASTSINNNTVYNLKATASLNVETSGSSVQGSTSVSGIVFVNSANPGANGTNIVSQNTIHNLENTSPNDISSQIIGIIISASTGFTMTGISERNKIYNLLNSGNTSVRRNLVGVFYGGGNSWTFRNHYLTLTNGSGSNPVSVFGFYDVNGQGRAIKLFNNSVYIGGTSSGTTASYGYFRQLRTSVNFRNNLFYNERTGGAFNVGIANGNQIFNDGVATDNWGSNASNYNVFITTASDLVGIWFTSLSSPTVNLADWVTASNGDRNSWSATNVQVSSSNLFENIATGDLSIKPGNAVAWYVNGKGVAGSQIDNLVNDFGGGSRNTTFGQGIDIGADEVSVDASTVLPVNITRVIGAVGDYDFIFAGRKVATVKVVTKGSLTSLALRYFSGENPLNPVSGAEYGNAYWRFEANGGASGYEYVPTLFYDGALNGTIASVTNANLKAARSISCASWELAESSADVSLNQVISDTLNFNADHAMTAAAAPLNDFAPFNLSAIVTDNNVAFDWEQAGADEYQIQYSSNSNFPTDLTGAFTFFRIPSDLNAVLNQGTYKWRVRASCGDYSGTWVDGSTFEVTSVLPACPDPYNLTAVQDPNNANNIIFTWAHPNPAAAVNGYALQYSTNPDYPTSLVGAVTINILNPNATTYTAVNLPNGNYRWRMRTRCASSTFSTLVSGNPFTSGPPIVCNAPTAPVVTRLGPNTVLSWGASPNATNYSVQYSTNPNFPTDLTGAVTITSTAPTCTLVVASGTYKWRVATNCGAVQTEYVNGSDFVMEPQPMTCQTPFGLSAVDLGSGQVELNLSHPVPGWVQNYTVRYSTNPSFSSSTNNTVTLTVAAFPCTLNIGPGVYKWDVRANCYSGSGGSSTRVMGPDFTLAGSNPSCLNPTSLVVTQAASPSNYRATFSWVPDPQSTRFEVQISNNPNFPADLTGAVIRVVVAPASSVVVNLEQTGTYKWRVRSICSGATSSQFVNGSTFTVTDPVPSCTPPTPVSASYNPSNKRITFTWTHSPNPTSKYFIEYGIGNYNSTILTNFVTSTTTLNNQGVGTYQWRIQSQCPVPTGATSAFADGPAFTITSLKESSVEGARELGFSLSLVPNPAAEVTTVDVLTTSDQPAVVELYDLTGRLLQRLDVKFEEGLNRTDLDLRGLSNGLYNVSVRQGDFSRTERLSIQR
jgi:hypothetical protein